MRTNSKDYYYVLTQSFSYYKRFVEQELKPQLREAGLMWKEGDFKEIIVGNEEGEEIAEFHYLGRETPFQGVEGENRFLLKEGENWHNNPVYKELGARLERFFS